MGKKNKGQKKNGSVGGKEATASLGSKQKRDTVKNKGPELENAKPENGCMKEGKKGEELPHLLKSLLLDDSNSNGKADLQDNQFGEGSSKNLVGVNHIAEDRVKKPKQEKKQPAVEKATKMTNGDAKSRIKIGNKKKLNESPSTENFESSSSSSLLSSVSDENMETPAKLDAKKEVEVQTNGMKVVNDFGSKDEQADDSVDSEFTLALSRKQKIKKGKVPIVETTIRSDDRKLKKPQMPHPVTIVEQTSRNGGPSVERAKKSGTTNGSIPSASQNHGDTASAKEFSPANLKYQNKNEQSRNGGPSVERGKKSGTTNGSKPSSIQNHGDTASAKEFSPANLRYQNKNEQSRNGGPSVERVEKSETTNGSKPSYIQNHGDTASAKEFSAANLRYPNKNEQSRNEGPSVERANKSGTANGSKPSSIQYHGVTASTKEVVPANLRYQNKNQQSSAKIAAGDKTLALSNGSVTGFELAVPQRQAKSGCKGRPIIIETNHVALYFKNLTRAVHYDVSITPNTPKHLLRAVMERFRQKFYKDRYPAYDGARSLYSSTDLPFDKQIVSDVTVTEKNRDRPFRVVVKFTNYVDMTSLQKFITSTAQGIHHLSTPQDVLQCLDIVLRSAPALTFIPIGRCYFTQPRDQILNLGGGMEMYYGFYQSAILGWKPFLNVDVAHKAFPISQNVISLILELCNLKPSQLQQPLEKRDEITVGRFLTTLKIEYQIPNVTSSKREYRVNGLERPADNLIFESDGKTMTVLDYFRKMKDITLRYPKMPCLWVGNKQRATPIYLPVEFCTIVPAQSINRKLPEKIASLVVKTTATSTKVRKDKILDSINTAQFNQNPCIREFGISIDDKFAQINARVLDAPSICYNGNVTVKPNQGAWKPQKFCEPATLAQWTIVNLDRFARKEQIEDFVKLIIMHSSSAGMKIAQPQRPFVNLTPTPRRELQDIEEAFTKIKSFNLIFVIIPSNGLFYSQVKRVAELEVGCLTQCVKTKTLLKMSASTVFNILLKVNAKLKGVNHVIQEKLEWMKRPYMVMGADVTHPSPESRDKTSIAAVTASHDSSAFRYNICYRLQPPKVEIIEDLEKITREHLLRYHVMTKCKPERIVFFRDGVSEGQFAYVMNTEIQAIRRACTGLQPDGSYKPKITFLVVQKRHHTRFFPTCERDTSQDKNLNVPVGTCVDTDITHPTAMDFCLVSHSSIQGVARPTKYRVLWDDADLTEDELEQLSFYFCHMFARCTRSISYPAPTYYAHLAASRITAYTDGIKLNLNNLEAEQNRLAIKTSIVKNHPMFFV